MVHLINVLFSSWIILAHQHTLDAKYTGPTNQAGLDLIKEFEGFHADFYLDPVGIKTIGYGHACHSNNCRVPLNGRYSVPLTRSTAENLLKEDLGLFENCVNSAVTYSGLNADQFSALVSFAFNLGCGRLRSSTLRTKINQGNLQGASEEFGSWIRAGGRVLNGLIRRRDAEKRLFCSGRGCEGPVSRSSLCLGRINSNSLNVNVRPRPNTFRPAVGIVSDGESVSISRRVSGMSVNGNTNWFRIPNGYVSANYVTIISSNGQSWCSS